jgi:hypothetical protein
VAQAADSRPAAAQRIQSEKLPPQKSTPSQKVEVCSMTRERIAR